ncbi:1-acyl-sn-glycerol-3-phosphate acyltransferase [Nereida sp. MMG025]|uniref:1-acyl-sn-glycerol-3-phosphate acyltransferase n=1 Tax=Nereida sp. MMG025 TaxID=2909981 RepID=UPI001F028B54|nr:1-acyl-sn-glycerol-3-phosphate acyltransferase [Nereida sp. MMG025]MCF6445517.1 1-acyl-sn-glycerol-3-phosphate acyltransferase [Nereida sp. MMG025]
MFETVAIPYWGLLLIGLFAAISIGERLLFPSVRWFFRKRAERVVARVNQRLSRPIEPFKLARRYDMIQRLTYDSEVLRAVAEHAAAHGEPDEVALERARRYAREIVPSFSATAYFGIGTRAARWLGNALYRVRLGHVEQASIDGDATVVFVMNHRSNMDYVLVTYLAARASALSYAVGEWARVWPLSRLIKAMGAYFIRRKSRGELYRTVLRRYVHMATTGGVTQAVFPEGGLSLDGKIAPPKLGLLTYMVEAWAPDARDIVFVPVAINYDRVLEDRILIAANEAGSRRFKARMGVVTRFALKHLWLRLTGRFYKFGYASVSFGAPVSLKDWHARGAEDLTKSLAAEVVRRIEAVMPVLPVPAVARVMLAAKDGLTEEELAARVSALLEGVEDGHLHLPRGDLAYASTFGLRNMMSRGMLEKRDGRIYVAEGQRSAVAYYANSIAHVQRNSDDETALAEL